MRETIWAARGLYWDDPSIVYPTPTQYTRTDVADARIEELEMALLECREEIEGLHQDAAGASL
jgi:hypothetical protein